MYNIAPVQSLLKFQESVGEIFCGGHTETPFLMAYSWEKSQGSSRDSLGQLNMCPLQFSSSKHDGPEHPNLPDSNFFLTQFLYQAICTQKTPRDPINRRLYEHGIWYISDTARNWTHNLFHPKCALIPPGHSEGQIPSYHSEPLPTRSSLTSPCGGQND